MNHGLRCLQLSDVHFGARLTAGRLGMSRSAAARREQERRESFTRAMDLVGERHLDGVLIPGDLFDDEVVSSDTLRFVMERLGSIAPKPVFISPGNHDPYGGASAYHPGDRGRSRGLTWPENVHIFAHEDFRTLPWPGRDDVTVTGCGVAANKASAERRLAPLISRPEVAIPLLLFHGSRDDGQWLQSHKSTYPFSEHELRGQQFHWTAIGHYHDYQLLQWEDGQPMGAYSGCLHASGLDETGPKGCLIVELGEGPIRVEFVTLDPREIHALRCDLTGAMHADEAMARVLASLETAAVRDLDIIHLRLVGRQALGLDLGFLDSLVNAHFHLKVDLTELIPDVDLDSYPSIDEAASTEERFVARMKEAAAGGGSTVARRALLYGLDALHRRRVEARYEE